MQHIIEDLIEQAEYNEDMAQFSDDLIQKLLDLNEVPEWAQNLIIDAIVARSTACANLEHIAATLADYEDAQQDVIVLTVIETV